MLSLQNVSVDTRHHTEALPDYSLSGDAENPTTLAKKVNKYFNGSSYKLITDPAEFVGPYKEQIKKAENSFDPDDISFTCSCNYDVDSIHGPRMERGRLVFYVHSNSEFPTPRKITCENPTRLSSAQIVQECLPYAK